MASPRASLNQEVASLKSILTNRDISISRLYASNTNELVIEGKQDDEDFVWFRGNIVYPVKQVLRKHGTSATVEDGRYQLVAADDYFAIRGKFRWSHELELPLDATNQPADLVSVQAITGRNLNGFLKATCMKRAYRKELPWLLGYETESTEDQPRNKKPKKNDNTTMIMYPHGGEISYVLGCDNLGTVKYGRGIHSHMGNQLSLDQSIICRVGKDLWTSWISVEGNHELYKNGCENNCWKENIGPEDAFLRTIYDIGGQPLFLTTPASEITSSGTMKREHGSLWWQGKRIMKDEDICYTPANFKGKPLWMTTKKKVYWGDEVLHRDFGTNDNRQQQVLSSPDSQHYAVWDDESIILDGKRHRLGSIWAARRDSDSSEMENVNWSVDWIGPSPALVVGGSAVWWNGTCIPFNKKEYLDKQIRTNKCIHTNYQDILNCNGELAMLYRLGENENEKSWLWYKKQTHLMPPGIDALVWANEKIVAASTENAMVWVNGAEHRHKHVSHFRTLRENGLPPRITILGADDDCTTIYSSQGITRIPGRMIQETPEGYERNQLKRNFAINGFVLPLHNGICALANEDSPSFFYGGKRIARGTKGQNATASTSKESWTRIGRDQWDITNVKINWPTPVSHNSMADLENLLRRLFPNANEESLAAIVRKVPEGYNENLGKVTDKTYSDAVLHFDLEAENNAHVGLYCKISKDKDAIGREIAYYDAAKAESLLRPILPQVVWSYNENNAPLGAILTIDTHTPWKVNVADYRWIREKVLSHLPDSILLSPLSITVDDIFNVALLHAVMKPHSLNPAFRTTSQSLIIPEGRIECLMSGSHNDLVARFKRHHSLEKEVDQHERETAETVVHGDARPANIFPRPDGLRPRGDFGCARIGTPEYDIAKMTDNPEHVARLFVPVYIHCRQALEAMRGNNWQRDPQDMTAWTRHIAYFHHLRASAFRHKKGNREGSEESLRIALAYEPARRIN